MKVAPARSVFCRRTALRFVRPTLLLAALTLAAANLHAAVAATLSFDVTARAAQVSGGGAQHTTNAHVLVRGEQVRVESSLSSQRIVMLWLRPYVYRLLPSSKSGVRYKASTPVPEMQALASDWPQLMSNPSRIRAVMQARGARKVGAARLNGTAADVYAASRWNGKNQAVKIWLRHSDALPLRMETRSGDWKITVNWRNYVRNPKLAAALFAVPKGYRIRDVEAPRSVF